MQRWSKPKGPRRLPLTPLIDVVFLLLIFFVMAGRFADEARIVLKTAPQGGAQTPVETQTSPMMLVSVDQTGQLSLLGKPVTNDELAAKRPADASIVLKLAPKMPLEVMVDVIDQLKTSGIDKLSYLPSAAESNGGGL